MLGSSTCPKCLRCKRLQEAALSRGRPTALSSLSPWPARIREYTFSVTGKSSAPCGMLPLHEEGGTQPVKLFMPCAFLAICTAPGQARHRNLDNARATVKPMRGGEVHRPGPLEEP